MAKARTHYLCRECGGVQSRWLGRCPACGAWDGLERFVEPGSPVGHAEGHAELATAWSASATGAAAPPRATPLLEIEASEAERLPTEIGELDRVLGGGLVPGSVVLLGGEPGIGKSTLLLQAAARIAGGEKPGGRRSTGGEPGGGAGAGPTVLYVSSEESPYQTRLRAERLFGDAPNGLESLFVLAESDLGRIVEQVRAICPAVVMLDSIQMVFKRDVDAAPGSVAQLRRCCTELVYLAKVSGIAVVLIGHVTKDGSLAGPKMLEHLVDAVLTFEGERHHAVRVVRAVKNRFGPTLEVGLFEMTGRGLIEIAEPGASTGSLDADGVPIPGSVLCPVLHGSRCLMVEIQALTATGFLGSAKRRATGLDAGRLAMLIAVLEKHAGLRLSDQDVFASAAGGLKVLEPAADLALCLAVAGAHTRRRMQVGTAAVGEVGLGGEVRGAVGFEQRVRAASRLGCRSLFVGPGTGSVGIDLVEVRTIGAALEAALSGPPGASHPGPPDASHPGPHRASPSAPPVALGPETLALSI